MEAMDIEADGIRKTRSRMGSHKSTDDENSSDSKTDSLFGGKKHYQCVVCGKRPRPELRRNVNKDISKYLLDQFNVQASDTDIVCSKCQHQYYKNKSAGSTEQPLNITKHLRMLQFKNPGKFMEDFDPERSAREMRKMNRRIYRENIRKNQMYDETGILLENGKDLCDCLDTSCPGCHFPCPKCESEKCGTECRRLRKWVYDHVEVEGTNLILKWPPPVD